MNKYKKIALKLWGLDKELQKSIISDLSTDDTDEILEQLNALKLQGINPHKKAIDLVFEKYLNYSHQEIELLSSIDSKNYQAHFQKLVRLCFDNTAEAQVSKKVKIQLIQMAGANNEL